MEKVVWTLSDEDKDRIQNLFERKLALENLSKILEADNNELYERLVKDYGRTCREFNQWWQDMSQKHRWEGTDWRVDFVTGNVKGS